MDGLCAADAHADVGGVVGPKRAMPADHAVKSVTGWLV